MHAITIEDQALSWTEMPTPAPAPGQVRVRVQAAGVNRADLVQRAGRYPAPPGASPILGLECAGAIDALGEGVTSWAVGDPCCALLTGGGYATHVVCDARHALPIPAGLTPVEAAAVVEVWTTAWLNLMTEGELAGRSGASVLVHAGASGVGTAAVQICRAWGHRCFVTVGSEAKVEHCMALGAEGGHVRHDGPWLDAVKTWAPDGVDVILDPVGANYLEPNVAALALEGRLVSIGLLSGRSATLDMGRMLVRRLRLKGSTLRSRSDTFKATLLTELREQLWPRFADGNLKPQLHATFPIAEADAAHELMKSNTTIGALVLVVP